VLLFSVARLTFGPRVAADRRRRETVCCHPTCRKELCELGRFGDTSQITQLVVAPLLQRARFLPPSLPPPVSSSRALVPRLEGARDRGSLSLSLSRARWNSRSLAPAGVRLDPDARFVAASSRQTKVNNASSSTRQAASECRAACNSD